ncbi:hypothetical protein BJ912DRAFT_409538 [Pholiota molesta]|nr:hypothetical protein BJ912DRAFT_409538 [Pholiota molesta]
MLETLVRMPRLRKLSVSKDILSLSRILRLFPLPVPQLKEFSVFTDNGNFGPSAVAQILIALQPSQLECSTSSPAEEACPTRQRKCATSYLLSTPIAPRNSSNTSSSKAGDQIIGITHHSRLPVTPSVIRVLELAELHPGRVPLQFHRCRRQRPRNVMAVPRETVFRHFRRGRLPDANPDHTEMPSLVRDLLPQPAFPVFRLPRDRYTFSYTELSKASDHKLSFLSWGIPRSFSHGRCPRFSILFFRTLHCSNTVVRYGMLTLWRRGGG